MRFEAARQAAETIDREPAEKARAEQGAAG